MFEAIEFNGTFRSYQQEILDRADEYLADKKINIVAAPGSGKTILGLELIRRLGKPCIILSPTVTIRDQWKERFLSAFTGADQSLVSCDLKDIRLITSITYQALYSAVARVKCSQDDEEVDNSSIDLFSLIKEKGIGTVCLDEAHHLQNEWQRALETFIQSVNDVYTISLTATPPYDASPNEWKRYISVCGEIDEEIFVPELVNQGTLCPHQDYVYFNYPRENETAVFKDYRERVGEALNEVTAGPVLKSACERLTYKFADASGILYSDFGEISDLLSLFGYAGLQPDKRLAKDFEVKKHVKFDLTRAEQALNYLLTREDLLFEKEREDLKSIFAQRGLIENGKISLNLNEKLKRVLVSSAGKLDSISKIAEIESASLKEKLRLLVLTDYVKKDETSSIGTDKKFNSVSIISVFETLRRASKLPVGALSGSVVVLPVESEKSLKAMGAEFTVRKLNCPDYAEYSFKGNNRDKVRFVSKLFENGDINIIVGTKSLLGEGWDSPCINTLILASFVGSFMLSNQMRGRAIRTDKNNPDKTSNIWHLATVEPDYIFQENAVARAFGKMTEDKQVLKSYDYEILSRRFECFVAPAYDRDVIENGTERLTTIRPPYDKAGIDKINARTAELAVDRGKLKEKWKNALDVSDNIGTCSQVPKDRKVPAFTFYNVALTLFLTAVLCTVIYGFATALSKQNTLLSVVLGLAAIIPLVVGGTFISRKILLHCNPLRSIKLLTGCIVATLQELSLISSSCKLKVDADDFGTYIDILLVNSSLRDQKIFHKALSDLFSPIENPRYVLIPRWRFGYRYSCALACPDVLGSKQEYASLFAKKLKTALGKLDVVYTRREKGGLFLYKCRSASYITFNAKSIKRLMKNY